MTESRKLVLQQEVIEIDGVPGETVITDRKATTLDLVKYQAEYSEFFDAYVKFMQAVKAKNGKRMLSGKLELKIF